MPTATREIVLWRNPADRPQAVAADAEAATKAAVRRQEADARLAVAEAKKTHARIQQASMKLVLSQIEKWLRLSEHEDFANAIGPIDPKTLLQLAEFATKNFRLDNGQATENIAHAVATSIDFSKMTQEQRNQWRELAKLGGASDEE